MTERPPFPPPGSAAERRGGRRPDAPLRRRRAHHRVATDAESGEVLMVAHMNAEALARTLATGEAWYWSRSRRELWHKGATSGQTQSVVEMRVDCDQDAVWLRVRVGGDGGCCHTGRRSCFYSGSRLPPRAGYGNTAPRHWRPSVLTPFHS